jgi:hypothetical protein
MKNGLWIIGVLAAIYLFSKSSTGSSTPLRPMPTTPCGQENPNLPPGGNWIWNTNPLSEGFNSWVCVGSNLKLPLTQHADGHYYDANGAFVS